MLIKCDMFLPPKKNRIMGSVTVEGSEIIIRKRSMLPTILFGALGAALTSNSKGKEIERIQSSNVQSVEMKKYKLAKKACFVTLKDQTEYIFLFPSPDRLIPDFKKEIKFEDPEIEESSL